MVEGDEGLLSQRKGKSGRKQALTPGQRQALLDDINDRPFTAATELRVEHQLGCTARTVRNHLHRGGVHSRRPARKVDLEARHAEERLRFARAHLEEDWEFVIFSDEKVFQSSQDTRRPLWRRNNTRYAVKNVQPVRRSGRLSIAYWGWICSAGPGELVEVPVRMNAAEYLDVLENVMLPTVRNLLPGARITFVQDNSAVHRARIVEDWFQNHPEIRRIQWPARSPDLNPIEHMWASMVRHWDDDRDRPAPRRRVDLNAHVRRIWDWHRGNDYCARFIGSMRQRLAAVIEADGYYTSY